MKKFLICLMLTVICTFGVWATCFYTRTYNGIDISHHNDVCWKHIAEDPYVKFCYIKATEGKSFIDNKCESHAKNARDINLLVGLYHYFRTDVSAKDQFNNFKRMSDRVNPDLIPVIDIEVTGNDFSNTDKVNNTLSELITLFHNEYGVYPIIYYFGTKEIFQTLKSTYKCNFWLSSIRFPNAKPNFTIKQYKIGKIGCNTLDMDYCSDIDKLKLNI